MLLSKGASVVLKNKGNITPLQCSLEMVSLNPGMIVLYSSCAYDPDSGVGRAFISPQFEFEWPYISDFPKCLPPPWSIEWVEVSHSSP